MSSRSITEAFVQQVAEDLRSRYSLDDEDVRELGAQLADQARDERRAANLDFAQDFTVAHPETFDRLGK